jgi:hypothetical protein
MWNLFGVNWYIVTKFFFAVGKGFRFISCFLPGLYRSLKKIRGTFSNKQMQMQLGNVTPGLYLLQLTDSGGKVYSFKFIIAKQ